MPRIHHKRERRTIWGRFYCDIIPTLLLPAFLIIALVSLFQGSTVFRDFNLLRPLGPKQLVISTTILPGQVQQAVQALAKQEIKEEQANATLANSAAQVAPTNTPPAQSFIDSLQEALTTDPSDKAKLKLKQIDRMIQQLQAVLQKDTSNKAVDQAVDSIQTIGQETDGVATDKNVQADRAILAMQIEQYNRVQLMLQKIEDKLPIGSYLKIEEARTRYLVSGAQRSLNAAPNLEMVHNVALKEVAKQVGTDFTELKAIEILTDIGSGLNPQAKQKLSGLQKELALQFEKRMLKLSPNIRNRKLQNYIVFSYGNPLNQVQSFNQMQYFLTDREMILAVESLKELAVQKLEDRVSEIKDKDTLDTFLDSSFKSPQDLKVLAMMKLDVLAGQNENRKKQIAQLEADSQDKIIATFGKAKNLNDYFTQSASVSADLLDVSVTSQLATILENSPQVSADVKNIMTNIKQKTLTGFVANIAKNNFITQPKLRYNPVSANADVRLLIPAPQAVALLESIKNELSNQDKSNIVIAEKVNTSILATHLLTQVNDPIVFGQYQKFIQDNQQVKQLIQTYVGQNFFNILSQKKKLIDQQDKKNQQALYEKMQQVVQQIFITKDKTSLEGSLPQQTQEELANLKKDLPDKSVPKLETPPDVVLPAVAALPVDVQNAIVIAAKAQIKQKHQSKIFKLESSVLAKELGVVEPTILPDNSLYVVQKILRGATLVVKTDPIDRAEELLRQDNEKTLEAAQLVEKSQSQRSINTALKSLESVAQDFEKLKKHTEELTQLKQTQPQKVDQLIDQIINNGLARQTVFSLIEDKVHGDEYVIVEKMRQEILRDGVNTLLNLTDQNVQKLTDTLEKAVNQNSGSELKDIKAVELLNEIARTQPEEVKKVLEKAEVNLSSDLETKLLTISKEQRTKELLDYAQNASGNPVRQFEAYDLLKDNFKNPETILLTEGLKDKASENLQEIISEIPDATAQQKFVDQVVGNEPQDLKIITEIEARVEPPQNVGVVEVLPVVQKVQNIQAEVEQNIIDTYKSKPEELAKTDFFNNPTPDVIDIQVVQELHTALDRSPEVIPEVVAVVKQEEQKIVDTFVANVSKPEFQTSVSVQTNVSQLAAETLNPVPDTLAILVDLKGQVAPAEQAKIDLAINAQVNVIQDHLINEVNDPKTFQTYITQIEENPVVAKIVSQVGSQEFAKAVETKAQEVETVATKEQSTLETTVAQVQQEVFSSSVSVSAPVIQTLPEPVQQQVEQIKQEVPSEQIPPVTVSVQTSTPSTVTTEPVTTAPVQTSTPAQSTEAPQAPAPPSTTVPGL